MSNTQPISPTYLTLQQLVAEGFAGYSTLRAYVADGRLPAVRVGNRIKVRREDVDALAVPTQKTSARDVVSAVERIVADAPPLTEGQRERLAVILRDAS